MDQNIFYILLLNITLILSPFIVYGIMYSIVVLSENNKFNFSFVIFWLITISIYILFLPFRFLWWMFFESGFIDLITIPIQAIKIIEGKNHEYDTIDGFRKPLLYKIYDRVKK